MRRQILHGLLLLCVWSDFVHAEKLRDVTMRYHAQWDVGDQERQILLEKYGIFRVSFDQKGQARPYGLSAPQEMRWKRLYELCMRDGCYFCDADEGSCETGTCGPQNVYCKPYMGREGLPNCGFECADYAFIATLI